MSHKLYISMTALQLPANKKYQRIQGLAYNSWQGKIEYFACKLSQLSPSSFTCLKLSSQDFDLDVCHSLDSNYEV